MRTVPLSCTEMLGLGHGAPSHILVWIPKHTSAVLEIEVKKQKTTSFLCGVNGVRHSALCFVWFEHLNLSRFVSVLVIKVYNPVHCTTNY